MKCTVCGTEISKGAAFCNQCGNKVQNNYNTNLQNSKIQDNSYQHNSFQNSNIQNNSFQNNYQNNNLQNGNHPNVIPRNVNLRNNSAGKKTAIIAACIALALLATASVIFIILFKKGVFDKKEDKEITEQADSEIASQQSESETEAPVQEEMSKYPADIDVFEIRDDIFLVNMDLFGKSYSEIEKIIKDKGYIFAVPKDEKWIHASTEDVSSNRIDLDDKRLVQFFFQRDKLVSIIYVVDGIGIINPEMIEKDKQYFDNAILSRYDDPDKVTQLCCRYGDKEEDKNRSGYYGIFLDPYGEEGIYTDHIVQQYLSDGFVGGYISDNFIKVDYEDWSE